MKTNGWPVSSNPRPVVEWVCKSRRGFRLSDSVRRAARYARGQVLRAASAFLRPLHGCVANGTALWVEQW